MFTTIYEHVLGPLVRVRIVRNDRNKVYLDLRMLTDKGYNTTSGLFIPSEEVAQFAVILAELAAPDTHVQYSLGKKHKVMLKKVENDGSVTVLVSRRPTTYDLSGLRMSAKEYQTLMNHFPTLTSTIKSQEEEFPPLKITRNTPK